MVTHPAPAPRKPFAFVLPPPDAAGFPDTFTAPLAPDPARLRWPLPILVSHVYDGDTVRIQTPEGVRCVRLVGVDAPEYTAGQSAPAVSAIASRFALMNLSLGAFHYAFSSLFQSPRDGYGRDLLFLFRADSMLCVNLEMIRQGWAKVPSGFPHEFKRHFIAVMRDAHSCHRGLWGATLWAPAPTQ